MGTEKKTLVMDEAVLSVPHSSLPGVHRGGYIVMTEFMEHCDERGHGALR